MTRVDIEKQIAERVRALREHCDKEAVAIENLYIDIDTSEPGSRAELRLDLERDADGIALMGAWIRDRQHPRRRGLSVVTKVRRALGYTR